MLGGGLVWMGRLGWWVGGWFRGVEEWLGRGLGGSVGTQGDIRRTCLRRV